MNKTLIVGVAFAVVAFVASWYGDPDGEAPRVDAQQIARAPAPQTRAVALLDVDDLQTRFAEVSGLGSQHDVVEFREGNEASQKVRKLPGELDWHDLTLKRPISGNVDMWEWRQQVEDGADEFRKSGHLVLLDPRGAPVARFYLENAWPAKCTVNPMRAGGNDVLMEEFVLTVESARRID